MRRATPEWPTREKYCSPSRTAPMTLTPICGIITTIGRGAGPGTVCRDIKIFSFYLTQAECAFIDNPTDEELLRTRQDDFARAIARGVTDYELEVGL